MGGRLIGAKLWARRLLAQTREALSFSIREPEPRIIFDFSSPAGSEGWVSSSDCAFGGNSTCSFEHSPASKSAIFSGRVSSILDEEDDEGEDEDPYAPRLIFSGFVGTRSQLRADSRRYFCSVKTSGELHTNDADLYQTFIPEVTPGALVDVCLPLKGFFLTWKGSVQQHQPVLNPANITSIGFGMADKASGDFELEVVSVSACLQKDFLQSDLK